MRKEWQSIERDMGELYCIQLVPARMVGIGRTVVPRRSEIGYLLLFVQFVTEGTWWYRSKFLDSYLEGYDLDPQCT
jgi:hypothetical protein